MRYPLLGLLAARLRSEQSRLAVQERAAREVAHARADGAARVEALRDEEVRCRAAAAADVPWPASWAWQAAVRFRERRRGVRAAAVDRLVVARRVLGGAEAALAAGREGLAAAVRERAAVTRHMEVWLGRRRRTREAAAEGEAEDTWRPVGDR